MTPITASRTRAIDALLPPGEEERLATLVEELSELRGPAAQAALARYRKIVLVGTTPPVAFFAYPGKPSLLAPEGCEFITLAEVDQNLDQALAALADRLGASALAPAGIAARSRPAGALPTGKPDAEGIAGNDRGLQHHRRQRQGVARRHGRHTGDDVDRRRRGQRHHHVALDQAGEGAVGSLERAHAHRSLS